jgi:NADH dehydrogenase [ubiquinone] 1 alpha subcomplex assembly factor 7
MADALRAAGAMPDFVRACRLHLVETSPALRSAQAEKLAAYRPIWHDGLGDLPAGPALILANEFLDALPIRQFLRTRTGWHERLVGLAPDGDGLVFGLSPTPLAGDLLVPAALREAPPGSLWEIAPTAVSLVQGLAARLVQEGGAALFIDYGHAAPGCGETLQAVRRHRPHPVLSEPGDVDLTAHVDFAAIAAAAAGAGARCWGPVGQGEFLRILGIEARAERLLQRADGAQAGEIRSASRRLIEPGEMGTLFKVLAIAGPQTPPPAGFPPASAADPAPSLPAATGRKEAP